MTTYSGPTLVARNSAPRYKFARPNLTVHQGGKSKPAASASLLLLTAAPRHRPRPGLSSKTDEAAVAAIVCSGPQPNPWVMVMR